MASSYQQLLSWLGSGDSLQPEAPPERRRVAGGAPALSPQQPPRQRAGCERIIVVLVHAVPCNGCRRRDHGRSCAGCSRNCLLVPAPFFYTTSWSRLHGHQVNQVRVALRLAGPRQFRV